MDPRFRDHADPFPLLDGDPVDTCTRIMRRTALTPHDHDLDRARRDRRYTQKRWRHILDTALSAAEESGRLAVDVDDATFLGCGAVLDLATRAQQGSVHGVQVSMIDSVPSVLDRVIAITGLTEWLPVHADLAEMLAIGPRQARAPIRPTVLTPITWSHHDCNGLGSGQRSEDDSGSLSAATFGIDPPIGVDTAWNGTACVPWSRGQESEVGGPVQV